MKIEYTYKIVSVDKEAKSMEIVYESPKYGVLHVGARLPWKEETLEDIVLMYNPTRYWLEQETETLEVPENASGMQSVEYTQEAQIDAGDEGAERKKQENNSIKQRRAEDYRRYSDPLFFKCQRGEATHQEWLDAVQNIKDLSPYVE